MSSDKYVNEGIPVLTAGKTFILGYTNETNGIKKASKEKPVILFDDFTTDLKFIDFDFKIKSSAAKILTEQKENDIYFLFNVLKNIDYKPHDHQRHWISIFENFDVFLPSFDEQKKISSFLKIIEKKETTIKGKTKALKKYKEGAKQKLFNSECGKEKHKLKEYLIEYSKKNSGLYKSVTVGKQGIRSRDEVYGKELSSNIANNKVLVENSLVIGLGTKQIDVCVNTTDGIYSVSPAYHTFKISNIDAYYLDNLLSTKNAFLSNKFMIQSARQGKSVDIKGLLDYDIYVDSKEVQNTISSCIRQIDNLIIELEQKQNALNSTKEYLLKNMFI